MVLSILFLVLPLSAETTENPIVRNQLREQAEAEAAAAEKMVEATESTRATSPPVSTQRAPPNGADEQNVCTNQLEVFAARPSAAAPPLQTCQMHLDSKFAELLKAYIPQCAKEAALKSGLSAPTRVALEQMGGFNVRQINTPSGKGESWSRHSLGMALDISSIKLFNGSYTKKIDLTKNTTDQKFYNDFRSCWNSAIEIHNGKESCTCSIGHQHTHDPSNELHDDHMHISLSCPPQSGVAVCSSF